MRVRKVLTTAGAIAAAGILALTPTAAHAAIATIVVNGVAAPNADVAIDGVLTSASATYGGSPSGCGAGGTIAGKVKRGNGGLDPNPAFSLTAININCGSAIIPTNLAIAFTCPVDVVMSNTNAVNVGTTDTNIQGVAKMTNGAGTDCVRVAFVGAGCRLDLRGTVAAKFDETVTTVAGTDYQELSVNGAGLTTQNATGLCAILIPNNSAVTVSAAFLIHVTGTTTGVIDFQ